MTIKMKLEDYKNSNHHLFHFYNKRPSRHIFRINRKWSCSYVEIVKSWFIFKIMYVCTKSIIMKRLKHIFDTIILWFHKYSLQNQAEIPFQMKLSFIKIINFFNWLNYKTKLKLCETNIIIISKMLFLYSKNSHKCFHIFQIIIYACNLANKQRECLFIRFILENWL